MATPVMVRSDVSEEYGTTSHAATSHTTRETTTSFVLVFAVPGCSSDVVPIPTAIVITSTIQTSDALAIGTTAFVLRFAQGTPPIHEGRAEETKNHTGYVLQLRMRSSPTLRHIVLGEKTIVATYPFSITTATDTSPPFLGVLVNPLVRSTSFVPASRDTAFTAWMEIGEEWSPAP